MTATRAYLDYNASAPLRDEARRAMLHALSFVGNASSVHTEGRAARSLIETVREQVAALVGAQPSEVVFTSGATEANNWFARAGWDRIFASGIEHDSVLAPLRSGGSHQVAVPAGQDGVVCVETIAETLLLSNEVMGKVAITLQMANNETGVLQPVAETAAFAREHGIFMHSDAVQAAGREPIDFAALGADAISLSSHKIGGPQGSGALIVRDGVHISPFVSGGGQERRRRAGTENIAAIAGFGAAAEAAARDLEDIARIRALRDLLEREVRRLTPAVRIIGEGAARIANTSCLALPGRRAETLLIKLDLAGIAVSAGAACSSGKVGISHVLDAMGLPPDIARSAIRISIGHATTEDEIAIVLQVWEKMNAGGRLAA